jgi:hypothetical protein
VSLPVVSDSESSDEFEEDGEDSNDESRTDFSKNNFFGLAENEFDIQDRNVSVYMMNWSVKYVTRKSKCNRCKAMLEYPYLDRRDPGESWDETLNVLKNSANSDSYEVPELSYGHVVKEEYHEIFFFIFRVFRVACIYYLNEKTRALICVK